MSTLAQDAKIVQAIPPSALGTAITGDFVSLKGYRRATIIIELTRGANATAVNFTVDKAPLVNGAGATTGIQLNKWWKNEDTAATDTLVRGAAGTSIAGITTQSKNNQYVIEIDAEELGEATPCIAVVTSAGHAAHFVSATYVLHPARYPQEGVKPSAILD